jgi:ribosomal protein L37AE/L43A
MSAEDRVYLCTACHWEKVPFKRWQLGLFTCLPCGEEQARAVKHTVVPIRANVQPARSQRYQQQRRVSEMRNQCSKKAGKISTRYGISTTRERLVRSRTTGEVESGRTK